MNKQRVQGRIIRKLVAEGKTASEIAKTTGYSQTTVRTRLSDMGLKAKPCPKVPDEVLIELADGTRTMREVVEATDGNQSVIDLRLRQLCLKTRKTLNNPPYASEEGRKIGARIAQLWCT
jgi:hypothetical protein